MAFPALTAVNLVLLVSVWTLVLFSSSSAKLVSYVLPAFPPLALALGDFVDASLAAPGVQRNGRKSIY